MSAFEQDKEIEVITTDDIMEKCKCSRSTAYGIIRGIKSVSDILGLRGKVTTLDFERWKEYKKDLTSNR